ncbi:class I SAM-dependent methyltransferase [Geojedonia litorea]|uniref:Class I SAM-dependent methyltransferase n=1 Tax=Geojedonia litorea TaxID=1268269 RepID=A0ABV9MYY9_9FLAO
MRLKTTIKRIAPKPILNLYKSITRKSEHKTISQTFNEIYTTHYWDSDESISGAGSDLIHTQTLIKELNKLLKQYDINSMLDIPCGDFNWMRKVDLNDINYIGADIVPDLIKNNILMYEQATIKFQTLDLTSDPLPKTDLIFCRDCLVHLSIKNIYKALVNIKKSKSRYLLTTSFVKHSKNRNIKTGAWRKLNLMNSPFYFSKPLTVINENYTKKGELDKDKSMCLWEIKSLKIPLKLKLYGVIFRY